MKGAKVAILGAVLLMSTISEAGTSQLNLGTHDFRLAGGAGFVNGHGAPTGMALRSGSPGQNTIAAFPQLVLAPGSTVTEVSMSYRYIVGYESAPSGHGANLSLSISDETLRFGGTVVYKSPHFTEYAYSHNSSNYSEPVNVHLKGLSVKTPPVSDGYKSRFQIGFTNNDRNLQLLIPISVNVTCEGADECFVPAFKPTPPPTPPPPPSPPPPKTNTPWKMIGPWNIGDDIHNGGEAGTIAPAVSVAGAPDVIYMGGNNNAAASGVLKSVDYGKHWTKINHGLFDTRLLDLFIVDDKAQHVLAGTPSGVFETLDGGKTPWVHVEAAAHWGVANSFRNGTINGKSVILVGTNAGLGNVPLLKNKPLVNETWSLIPSPGGSAAWRTNPVSVGDFDAKGKALENSVVAGCLWIGGHGVVHIATLKSETEAVWNIQKDQPCQALAVDPNNADHLLVNNASNGAHIYETWDGGKSYHGCWNQRGAVMVAIDRKGWFYTGSEAGAFRNMKGCTANGSKWEPYFVRRIARRTNGTRDRSAHDYQRINIDFGVDKVAFGSDQGMFIQNETRTNGVVTGTELEFYSANGDVNNNVIMHPAIAEGEAKGETCITTALWDWSPVASWDSGKHWPSWQTPDDGNSLGYFGEGGGCFGVGKSKNVLCMHHHNIGYSSRCGKDQTRFVMPNGASVAGPTFHIKNGTRSEPNGLVYAMMTMGLPPYDTLTDKALACDGAEDRGDLGVHTYYSCLSALNIGDVYNWYSGANVAVWHGNTDKHCHLCKLTGEPSSWNMKDTKGAIVYAASSAAEAREPIEDKAKEDGDGEYAVGPIRAERKAMEQFNKHVEKTRLLEMGREHEIKQPSMGFEHITVENTDNTKWVAKSFNFGANWTWIVLPGWLQALNSFVVDPTNDSVLYGISSNCVARSYDNAETWQYCWDAPGLEGNFKELVIKDSMTMIMMRNGAVPLRTKDGGKSWHNLNSVADIAAHSPNALYSWSGKTLALSTIVGQNLIWISTDDGDTWVDESGDYTALTGGIAQWYDNQLFICSLGQGISSKTFKEA